MGGGYYDRDVDDTPRHPANSSSPGIDYSYSTGWDSRSAYSAAADAVMRSTTSLDSDLIPLGRTLVCSAGNPIVIAMDVTGSMGNWTKIIYDKMPMLFGQIMMQGYLTDPAISFAAVGDANAGMWNPYPDEAPIQVCDFAKGDTLDDWLKRLWLEGGGGGQNRESYTLAAYAYLNMCTFTNLSDKPFFFLTGDEGFYETIGRDEIRRWVNGSVQTDVSSIEILKQLKDKFHVFMIHKPYDRSQYENEILQQWVYALGEERVLRLKDPKAVVDFILGAIALVSKTRDLAGYLTDMKKRDQTPARIAEVSSGLHKLNASMAVVPVNTGVNLPAPQGTTRVSRTKRL